MAQHTQALSSWLTGQLTSLHHSNGAPLIQLYGRHSEQQQATGFSQGAIFNFQVLQQDGQPVSFSRIDQEATAAGLFLRSGCVCNPGVSRLAVHPSAFVSVAEVFRTARLFAAGMVRVLKVAVLCNAWNSEHVPACRCCLAGML